jgi:4-hydroxy-2-oxoheptanedioate aldolase
MLKNPGLAKLRAGKPTVGPLLTFDSPDLAEYAAHLGFDWVWLDWQHGQYSEQTLNNSIARFLGTETVPIVRVKSQEPGTINRVLDMGAMGVVVPMVQNAAEARAVTQSVYYPPRGMRSGGGMRLGLVAGGSVPRYFAEANDAIMLVVMVETEEAIANVEEIMAVPGVGVVLIGPGDLMIDVKARGHDEAHHERLVQQVADASARTGVAAGYVCRDADQLRRRAAQGFRFLQYGSDYGIIVKGFAANLEDSRDLR